MPALNIAIRKLYMMASYDQIKLRAATQRDTKVIL
jgi:hypothetical protein